ncbi:MAG: hypothetical protein FJY10_09395 [Bacteroidetes bacterium]|nr:hypothetical protein [Bacteroidota bacterium]
MSRILLFHYGLEGGDFEVYRITDNGKDRFVKRFNCMDFDENDDEVWRKGEIEYPSFEAYWQEALRDEDWFRCYPMFIHDDCKPIIQRSINDLELLKMPERDAAVLEVWKVLLNS